MGNTTISVIIPVYNVAAYLRESIESVIRQTYADLQIILIDDESTDGSGQICDEYAAQDSRLTVIHQKNGGAANARNAGLRMAKGAYLAFLDSDDYLEPDAYGTMVELLEKYNADAVQCCYCDEYTDRTQERFAFHEQSVMDIVSYLKCFTQDWTCGLLWDKLYRKAIFDEVYFEEGHVIDDEFFTYQGLMNARRIVRYPKVIYHYRKRFSSAMLSPQSQARHIEDKLAYLTVRRKRVVERFPELKPAFDDQYLNLLLILSRDYYVSRENLKEIKRLLREYGKEKNKIRMPFGLARRLLRLKYASIEKLLREKSKEANTYARQELFS